VRPNLDIDEEEVDGAKSFLPGVPGSDFEVVTVSPIELKPVEEVVEDDDEVEEAEDGVTTLKSGRSTLSSSSPLTSFKFPITVLFIAVQICAGHAAPAGQKPDQRYALISEPSGAGRSSAIWCESKNSPRRPEEGSLGALFRSPR